MSDAYHDMDKMGRDNKDPWNYGKENMFFFRIKKERENLEKTKNKIDQKVANYIKKYVKEQVELWRQIPYLAVLASNKNENSYPEPYIAYSSRIIWDSPKHWKVNTKNSIYVDCFTANLIQKKGWHNDVVSPEDKELLSLESKIEILDAKKLIKTLEIIARLPEKGVYEVTRSDCSYSQWTEERNDEPEKKRALLLPDILKSKRYFEKYQRKK